MYVLLQQHNPYCIKLTLHKVIALIDCLLYMITYILYVSDHLPKWPLRYIYGIVQILDSRVRFNTVCAWTVVVSIWLFLEISFFLEFLVRFSVSSIAKQRMVRMCPHCGSSGILCFVPHCLLEADIDALLERHSCLKTLTLQCLLL